MDFIEYFCLGGSPWECRGSEQASPIFALLACGLLLSEGSEDPVGSRENYCVSLNYLEEFNLFLGVFFPRKGVITRDKFVRSGPMYMAGQTSNYQTCALLLIL